MNKELIEYALKELTPRLDKILACLDPKRIWSHEYGPGETFYSLDTRQLQSRHILRSWIYQGGKLEECSPKDYLAYRAIERARRTEFSVLEEYGIARIVWKSTVEAMPRIGNGGVYVLRKTNDHWVEMPDASYTWRS